MSGKKEMWELHRFMISPEFQEAFRADPVMDALDAQLEDKGQELLQLQAILDPSSCRITIPEQNRFFPVQFLTPLMWAKLYSFGNRYCTNAEEAGEEDTDIFFYAIHKGVAEMGGDLPEKARGFCALSGVHWTRMRQEIFALIYQAFFPLRYLPGALEGSPGIAPRFNSRWLLTACSHASRLAGIPLHAVMGEMALSEVIFLSVIFAAEKSEKGGLIEPSDDDILKQQMARAYELGRVLFRAKYGRDPEPDPYEKKDGE